MAGFFGEFPTRIDSKRRLAIASDLRAGIDPKVDGAGLMLVLGPDLHLWIYPDLAYRKLLEQLKPSPLPTPESEELRVWFATARVVRPDSQGRIVIPEVTMQRARTASEVTLVGAMDHVEVWPTQEWQEHLAGQMPHYKQTIYAAGQKLAAKREA